MADEGPAGAKSIVVDMWCHVALVPSWPPRARLILAHQRVYDNHEQPG